VAAHSPEAHPAGSGGNACRVAAARARSPEAQPTGCGGNTCCATAAHCSDIEAARGRRRATRTRHTWGAAAAPAGGRAAQARPGRRARVGQA
ncbi:MAG: hypothetical protein K5Q68_02825, partial [Roseococcus sp.]|nr:hypothetical protein [Roseococcus sp.]